jgi:L-cysteate sulfo-lyase
MSATRVQLGSWPTPLEPAPRLATALGLRPDDLWVKRDDLTGLGGGGNKVRKLEWTCGAALAEGATTLVTSGGAQSNHARLTAAAGARLGLDVVLVLAGNPGGPGTSAIGNIALDGLLGATVVWAGEVDGPGLAAAVDEVAGQLRAAGRKPAVIPFGGSSALAARGYADCGRELLDQAPDLATVVTAVGSGGTMAGLVDALGVDRVLGVSVGAIPDPGRTVAELASELASDLASERPSELASELASGRGGPALASTSLRLRLDQVLAGYAALTEPVAAALTLAARTEGIVLDPIYTGRALAGLTAAVEEGDVVPGTRTVFLHSGGLPGLFGHPPTLARARAALRELDPGPA